MKRAIKNYSALVFALFFLQCFLPAGAAGEEDTSFTPIPVIKGVKLLAEGTPAPVFDVRDITGASYNFAEHKVGKSHIIVFWSIFCEPCREEMPIVQEVYKNFKERDVEVLAVNLDGEPFLDGIKGFVNQNNFTFRVLLDELDEDTFKIADPYQVAGTPVLYLIDKKGQIFGGHLGRMTAEDLEALVTSMLDKG